MTVMLTERQRFKQNALEEQGRGTRDKLKNDCVTQIYTSEGYHLLTDVQTQRQFCDLSG